MSETSAVKAEVETVKTNEEKWSKELMAAGWTVLPSMILEKQHALGLDAIDINIIAHLSIYWWKKANLPHPSVATMATAIGVKPRTIQKHIKAMEASGFITRHERRQKGQGSKTNLYSFEGLIKAVTPYAKEKTAAIAERSRKDADRVARKKPKLALVKGVGK
jgi:DNA-binding transcriptional ArsR family regulator